MRSSIDTIRRAKGFQVHAASALTLSFGWELENIGKLAGCTHPFELCLEIPAGIFHGLEIVYQLELQSHLDV